MTPWADPLWIQSTTDTAMRTAMHSGAGLGVAYRPDVQGPRGRKRVLIFCDLYLSKGEVMSLPRLVVSIFSLASLGAASGVVCGQDFPSKPIRIVTTAAGGGSDTTVRIIGPGITGPLGQPIVVENRPNGFIAAEVVA